MFPEMYQPGDPVADILFNWLPFIGAVLAGAVGVVLLMLGFRSYVTAALLKKHGVRGRAVVRKKWVRRGFVKQEERARVNPMEYHYLRIERSDGGRVFSVREVAPPRFHPSRQTESRGHRLSRPPDEAHPHEGRTRLE